MAARLLLPGVAIAALLTAAFIAQRDANVKLGRDSQAQSQSEREVSLSNQSEKLLLDLETGLRGFVLTRDHRFLEPWRAARMAFPATVASLVALEAHDGPQHLALARGIQSGGQSYIRDYSAPGIRAVEANRKSASSLAVALQGKRRVDDLRAAFGRLIKLDVAQAIPAKQRAKAAAHRASVYELVGLLGALMLLVGSGLYLARAVLRPIRRVGDAADRMGAGDLSVRVEPTSALELSRLGGSFNEMAVALGDARDQLEVQTAEVRRSEAFLDSVIEHVPIMMFVKDAHELRYVRFNRAGEELLGYSREEVIGKNDHDFFPREEADYFTAKDRGALASGTLLDIPEERIHTRENGVRYLHTQKLAVLDEHGDPEFLLGISEDITERTHDDQAVRDAKEQAERASRAKSEFLSRMSHELRTPLNSILGFGQLLEMDGLSEMQREPVHYILKSGRHLLGLINEVLDISRIEAGSLTISPEPVAVGALLRDVVAMVGPIAAERGVRVATEPLALERHVQADQQRLKQVLLNLLSNAIKYNREGGTVSVVCERADPHLRITVRDSGRGIPSERLAEVFTPFERLGAEHGEIEGTGLGLALSHQLVQMMGGALSVQSEPAVGSTFTVELALAEGGSELAAADRALSKHEDDHSTPPARVLYIEDNLANVRLVERVVERRPGATVETAMQGRIGIELARHHQPDVIVLDLHLPDLTGDQVLQILKSDPRTARIPVIMLSADANSGQARRLRDLGADAYLTKPLDVPKFLAAIDAVLQAGALVK
ncbi:MAG: hypothetical protein QOD66_314 [Solirubrobacteraceae bacterium]|nr:hypothetical protein [Solirubrobacteraceae bacterium]